MNTQVTPGGSTTDYSGAVANISAWFERWRLIYAGLSCYQDGPALSNQGTVASCQVPMETTEFHAFPSFTTGTSTNVATSFCTSKVCSAYQANDLPSYERSQAMPNAFFGESKNGVYLPLRLGSNHQVWRSAKQLTHYVCAPDESTAAGFFPQVPFNIGLHTTAAMPNYIFPAVTANDAVIRWPVVTTAGDADVLLGHAPHPALRSFAWDLDDDSDAARITRADPRTLMMPQLAENVGHLSFRNLAVATGLQLYFRVGIEAQCPLGSPYVPYLKVAPEYDQTAVEMYYKVSRELKDAYPVEFNDLGKLWDVIKNAVRVVSGGLSFVPGPVGMIAGGINRLVTPSGVTLTSPPNPSPADKPPAAALERAQKVAASVSVAPRVRKLAAKLGKRARIRVR